MLAACLLVALAFGGVAAWAADSGQGGENKLTVHATNSTDEAFIADIAQASVQVDVYQVAAAEKDLKYDTYNYTLETPYSSLQDLLDYALDPKNKESNWQDFSDAAAKLLFDGAEGVSGTLVKANVPVGEALENLSNGLFMVIPHGAGKTPAKAEDMTADSKEFRYTFQATTVALPSKYDANEDGDISTAYEDGEWVSDYEISLKPTQTPLYGSLVINKTVTNFQGSKATFTYHIVSTPESPNKYDNWAAITVTSEGSTSTTLRHIKGGTIVTVSEIYDGSRFELVSANDQVATIVPDVDNEIPANVATVSFTNKGDNRIVDGSGIQNEFTYLDGDWKPKVTPESAETAAPAE